MACPASRCASHNRLPPAPAHPCTTPQTNFPPWHYLASPAECQSLLEAVAQVQQAAAGSGTPQGNKMPTPPSAERAEGHPEQQQPQQPQQPQQQQQALQQQQQPHQAGLGPGMVHIAAGVQPQQHGLQAPPPQVQQVQQQLEQQVQQARQQLEQAQQAQQALQQQFIMPGVPGPLAQQQQQQQQHTAGQLGTSASLDLGSQLARLSSLHAMAGGQPGSGHGPAVRLAGSRRPAPPLDGHPPC